MEVPKDFASQVSGLAASTPREAIANLLSALLPRVIARTRPPEPVRSTYRDIMETPCCLFIHSSAMECRNSKAFSKSYATRTTVTNAPEDTRGMVEWTRVARTWGEFS